MDGLRLEGQNLGPFLVIKYIKNYSYQNMSIIKVVLLFLYSSMKKKIRKIRLIFYIENYFKNQNCATVFDLGYQIEPNTYIQGVPKVSGRFFKNGCGIQISQATPTKFFMLFSIIMANFSENLVTIASIFPLSMALLD